MNTVQKVFDSEIAKASKRKTTLNKEYTNWSNLKALRTQSIKGLPKDVAEMARQNQYCSVHFGVILNVIKEVVGKIKSIGRKQFLTQMIQEHIDIIELCQKANTRHINLFEVGRIVAHKQCMLAIGYWAMQLYDNADMIYRSNKRGKLLMMLMDLTEISVESNMDSTCAQTDASVSTNRKALFC